MLPPSPLLRGARSTDERIIRMGSARVALGLQVGLAPGIAARIFGAPAEQLTPTARLVARLFGVRNVVLGAWTLSMRGAGADERRRCFQLNACVDAADLAVIIPSLASRELRRAAVMSGALAVAATLGWLELLGEV